VQGVRKTYQEQLRHTPALERALERVLWRCRTLDNTALEERSFLWTQRGVSRTRYWQEAELAALRADLPAYAVIRSHVLQDVLARLDTTDHACFRRAAHGAKPGSPEGTPKTVTRSKEAGGWSVSCSCAAVPTRPEPPTGEETGSDVGLAVFLVTADGLVIDHPSHQRQAEQGVKKAQ
jgi:hypothetical protein